MITQRNRFPGEGSGRHFDKASMPVKRIVQNDGLRETQALADLQRRIFRSLRNLYLVHWLTQTQRATTPANWPPVKAGKYIILLGAILPALLVTGHLRKMGCRLPGNRPHEAAPPPPGQDSPANLNPACSCVSSLYTLTAALLTHPRPRVFVSEHCMRGKCMHARH